MATAAAAAGGGVAIASSRWWISTCPHSCPVPFGNYSVVAAADGLLCIADQCQPLTCCVLNPLTRTCKVVPPVPFYPRGWLPPTPTTLAMFSYTWDERPRDWELQVATYDLAAASNTDSGGGWDWAAYTYQPVREEGEVAVAMCGGETFMFHDAQLRVLARRPGRKLVEVAALDQPPTTPGDYYYEQARLVAHGGAVFLVTVNPYRPEVIAWRLARDRLEWEEAARLHVGELQARLTGLMCSPVREGTIESTDNYFCRWGLYGVRDFVYCTVGGRHYNCRQQLIVRLNLDTGKWELVHHGGEQHTTDWTHLFTKRLELRPDLFL